MPVCSMGGVSGPWVAWFFFGGGLQVLGGVRPSYDFLPLPDCWLLAARKGAMGIQRGCKTLLVTFAGEHAVPPFLVLILYGQRQAVSATYNAGRRVFGIPRVCTQIGPQTWHENDARPPPPPSDLVPAPPSPFRPQPDSARPFSDGFSCKGKGKGAGT